jgi:hypothetical protein
LSAFENSLQMKDSSTAASSESSEPAVSASASLLKVRKGIHKSPPRRHIYMSHLLDALPPHHFSGLSLKG